MTADKGRSSEDLSRELEQERRLRNRVVLEAEPDASIARAFQQLATVVTARATLEELLQDLVRLFVEAGRVDVGVLRLCENDRLVSRAALGLEEEVLNGFSLPIAEGLPERTPGSPAPLISAVRLESAARSDAIREKGVRALHALPLVDVDGTVGVLYLGTFAEHDLPEQRRSLLVALSTPAAAAIVRRADHETLVQGVRSRDDVLAVVAHDLRNPLHAISIAANTLLLRFPDSTTRRSIHRIMRGTQRADRIVQDLLEINAIATNGFTIDTRPVETAELVLTALESQHGPASEASVIVATDLSPDLPRLEADEERLLEVLENLIGNALKFTSAGGTIVVGAARKEGEVLIWVKDSGSGIAPEQLPHIFDRFWQARKKERRGTGLGLTICKAIVEAHGGQIWAETTAGAGTTLFFTVPSVAETPPRPKTNSVSNILLVDDRPENLLSLKAILERPDYRLVTADSGEEALRLALREEFSVALIDVAMPRMDGLEVATHLKELERSRDIPIIFITAYGDDPEQIHRAYAAGGVDYLVKPLDSEIVRKKVAVFIDLSRRRRQDEDLASDGTDRTSER